MVTPVKVAAASPGGAKRIGALINWLAAEGGGALAGAGKTVGRGARKAGEASKEFLKWFWKAPTLTVPGTKNFKKFVAETKGKAIPNLALGAKQNLVLGTAGYGLFDTLSRLVGLSDPPSGFGSHMPWSEWRGVAADERFRRQWLRSREAAGKPEPVIYYGEKQATLISQPPTIMITRTQAPFTAGFKRPTHMAKLAAANVWKAAMEKEAKPLNTAFRAGLGRMGLAAPGQARTALQAAMSRYGDDAVGALSSAGGGGGRSLLPSNIVDIAKKLQGQRTGLVNRVDDAFPTTRGGRPMDMIDEINERNFYRDHYAHLDAPALRGTNDAVRQVAPTGIAQGDVLNALIQTRAAQGTAAPAFSGGPAMLPATRWAGPRVGGQGVALPAGGVKPGGPVRDPGSLRTQGPLSGQDHLIRTNEENIKHWADAERSSGLGGLTYNRNRVKRMTNKGERLDISPEQMLAATGTGREGLRTGIGHMLQTNPAAAAKLLGIPVAALGVGTYAAGRHGGYNKGVGEGFSAGGIDALTEAQGALGNRTFIDRLLALLGNEGAQNTLQDLFARYRT